jgi:mycothiol system anti-sigma-R factor
MECENAYLYLCGYLDGELDLERSKAIEEHLESCQSCRRELKLLQAVTYMIHRQCTAVTAPEHLKRRVKLELERADEYRESGVQALDLIRWGTHIAQLYNTKGDLAEVLVPYMEKGLEENELCVWVTSEMTEEEARDALSEEIPSLDGYINKGQLQLISCEDWYSSSGRFDGKCTLDKGVKKYQEALCNGYSGLRITGNAFWLDPSIWDSFMEYEDLVNSMVPDYRMLIICAYKESRCSKDNIVDVMKTHKYVLSKMGDSWRLRRSTEM